MKQNQVCYYIEDSQFGMYVSYGIYEYKTTCTHKVSRLKAPEIRLINGVPFDDFQSETEFKKVPKGWTYSTDLYTVTEDLEKKEKIGCSERSRGERIGYFSEFKYCGVAASMKEMPAINLESRVGIFRGVTESMTS